MKLGLMTCEIKADGLSVVELGGWNPLVVSSQRFTLHTRDVVSILSGSVPPSFLAWQWWEFSSLPSVSDIVFDAGFADQEEAYCLRRSPGDATFLSQKRFYQPIKNVLLKPGTNYGVPHIRELFGRR